MFFVFNGQLLVHIILLLLDFPADRVIDEFLPLVGSKLAGIKNNRLEVTEKHRMCSCSLNVKGKVAAVLVLKDGTQWIFCPGMLNIRHCLKSANPNPTFIHFTFHFINTFAISMKRSITFVYNKQEIV